AFSSGAGRTSDGNGSHASTLKSPSYTKSVSWQHYQEIAEVILIGSISRSSAFPIVILSMRFKMFFWHPIILYVCMVKGRLAQILDNTSHKAPLVVQATSGA
ncbi:hypothetical protein, partial [Enterobacter cloacae]|uniref:hypothetical protein n=3 Tax=Enterobacter cloacae TaxID=550 RepID=UPI001ADE210E